MNNTVYYIRKNIGKSLQDLERHLEQRGWNKDDKLYIVNTTQKVFSGKDIVFWFEDDSELFEYLMIETTRAAHPIQI